MPQPSHHIAVLGSTGSIGRNALEVIAASGGEMQVVAIAAHRSFPLLLEQAQRFRPRWVIATDDIAAASFDWTGLPKECSLLLGSAGLTQIAAAPEVDTVVAAIVGRAGLESTLHAVEAGKRVALANKETLVIAGEQVMRRARETGATIVPVDSEHSAVFQTLQAGGPGEVRRIILTASGGPFRQHTAEQLAHVTVQQALAHPTWNMGPKITIDSATMMNKALEIIEARWLFDLKAEQIEAVIHPQSIVHSLVEFVDGSVIAQLSPPDMKLPIQYALTYPRREAGIAPRLDWSRAQRLEFEPVDAERFPAVALGREVAAAGGTAGAVMSAANEAAVERFLAGELEFIELVPLVHSVLKQHSFEPRPTLERLIQLDAWARKEVGRWVCT